MKKRPQKEEKELAILLSELIHRNEIVDHELSLALNRLTPKDKDASEKPEAHDNVSAKETIGIWTSATENGNKLYLRDNEFSNEFLYWADVPKIETKFEKFRIVVLGESVARGWPIDPGYNPCISLGKIFNSVGYDVEIVDLARTNCGIADLKKLATRCLDLEPDAVVVFGGNNWIISCQKIFTGNHKLVEQVLDRVNQNDYEAVKSTTQNIIDQEIEELFALLGKISMERNLPTFVINPEFNLKDWRSNDLERLPMFNADGVLDWYQTSAETEEALQKGDLEKAESLSDQLIKLFPSNPNGYELKAECKLKGGEIKEAKKCLQDAFESKIYQTSCPGITVSLQERIRTMCNQHNLLLVDLPLIFEDYLNGDIPGREIFLDYCHMNVEGINISMYHLALKFFSEVFGTEMGLTLDNVIDFGHDNINDAKSHFLVAIHNAHWGQDLEIIHYHCKKALSYYNISDYMLAYARAMSSSCPGRLSKDFGFLVESGIFSTYILLTLQSDGAESFNLPLYNAIVKSLEEAGIDEEDNLTELRIQEHFTGVERVNLLKPYYHNGYKYNLDSKLKRTAYYKEYFKSSSFFIMANEENMEMDLEIVHRFPYNLSGTIEFELNGIKIGTASSGKDWTKTVITLPINIMKVGMNIFIVHWPLNKVSNNVSNIQASAEKGLEMLYEKMYLIIGEIHSLQAIHRSGQHAASVKEELIAQSSM